MSRILSVLGLLALACLVGCSPSSPKFENKSLLLGVDPKEGNAYVFHFDFVNTAAEPIQITSVTVFDDKNQKLRNDLEAQAERLGLPVELMTHDLKLTGYLKSTLGNRLRGAPKEMFEGTPLEVASIRLNGFVPEVIPEERTLAAGEAIRPSRYLFASSENYDVLTLKVTYRVGKDVHESAEIFKVTGELTDEPSARRKPYHPAADTGKADLTEQKISSDDVAQPRTDAQAGILGTLDRWLEPLIYRTARFSKRGDGLWLNDGSGAEKQIVKAVSSDGLQVHTITDSGQVLFTLGSKTYLLISSAAQASPLDVSVNGVTPSRGGYWVAILDFDKGAQIINLHDGTMLAIPMQPLPDHNKVFPEAGMDMLAMQRQLADPDNNRVIDGEFVWSAEGDKLAFTRCAGVCTIAVYDMKSKQVSLLPSADDMYHLEDDYRGQPQIYPVLFRADKLITSEHGLLREHELNTGHMKTLMQSVFAPKATHDGMKIAYINSKQPRAVSILDVANGEVHKLTKFSDTKPYENVGLSWSHDNRYLFYGIYYEDGDGGGWMMDVDAKVHRRIPLDGDRLGAKQMAVDNSLAAEAFTRNIRIPRFSFISSGGVRNAVIGFIALIAALLMFIFFRLIRSAVRLSGMKRMKAVSAAEMPPMAEIDEQVFCTECGAQCAAHAVFCPKCGARF